jgi:alkylated DNA nucleotide flippase Atl1
MKPESELSREYHQVKAILDGGWKGTYGDLAVCIGRSRRAGRIIGRLVKSYARRHPNWDHNNVVTKATNLPAYVPDAA